MVVLILLISAICVENIISTNPNNNSLVNIDLGTESNINDNLFYNAETFSGNVLVLEDGRISYALAESIFVEEFVNSDFKGFNGLMISEGIEDLPSEVGFGEIWSGIIVKLNYSNRVANKTFYMDAGADVSQINMTFNNSNLSVSPEGELIVTVNSKKSLTFSLPEAFQIIDGRKKSIDINYRVEGNKYGFRLGEYDKSYEVIITP